ncbi:MAG: RHS repeat-associated core domain-containing protein [Acidobacteriota bacterium]
MPLSNEKTSISNKSANRRDKTITSTAAKARNPLPQETAVEAVVIRHAPNINGRVEGTVRQLTGENLVLNSGAIITSALLVPGTPQVQINGNPTFGGVVQGTGQPQPTSYSVTINGNATLGRLVNRTDPIAMPTINAPPPTTGTRDVIINNSSQTIGDAATLRDLTINGNVGEIAVPPGTYRNFIANGSNRLVFGVAGSTTTSVYNLNALTLNGNAQLKVVSPVVLTVGTSLVLNGGAGSSTNPLWLTVKLASGGLTLNGGASLYGIVQAPAGTVIVNGNSLLQGSVICDRLIVNGNGAIKGTPGALASINPPTAAQGQQLTVVLQGINTHWVNGLTKASFGGEIRVGGAPEGEMGLIQVADFTTAVASIVVSSTAALAPRTVRVVTPVDGFAEGTAELLVDAFTVTANPAPGASAAVVSTFAGSQAGFADGNVAQAQFRNPTGVAAGANEIVYVADSDNHSIRKIAADGTVTTLAGNGAAGFADGTGGATQFNRPQGIAVDADNVVYVADTLNHRIRRITPDGAVTTIAGDGTQGFINGQGLQARFNAPQGVAIDNAGGLFIADTGNHAVRYVNANGEVSTLAGDGSVGSPDATPARFNNPVGVAFYDSTLYVYLADSGNHHIRRLAPNGSVVTIAGAGRGFADGQTAQARFADPAGIAIDGAGKLLVADSTNSLVRMIDVSNANVTTIAGTGARGFANGAGNVAKFFLPRSVVALSSGAMLVADSGNHVLRKITLPPVITSFSPTEAQINQTIVINGERFDARAPANNTVLFARSAETGGGTTQAQVLQATPMQLTVIIPQDATTGNVIVQNGNGTAVSPAPFTVVAPPPVITSFNPQRGAVGAQVTLNGTNLTASTGTTGVTFAGASNTRVNALVTSANPTQVVVMVPNAAVTGLIQLTNANGTAISSQPFVVEGGALDYQLTLSPTLASAVQGTSATYVVYATANSPNFSQLIALSVTGLPAGIIATFEPQQLTAGASATLKLNLASANLAAGSYSFTVRGSAPVDGSEMARATQATLNVLAAGQTTLAGRVLSTENEPVPGATVSLDGRTATTDAAGSFLLTGVSAGVDRALMIDGRTAAVPNRTYPVIAEPATILANQANVVPYIFYLPAIDTQYEVTVVPGQDTVVTTPRVAGVSMTIPAGANLRNRDGSPVARVSITPVPIDRTPAPLPPNVFIPLVFTSQPGSAIADVAMPVIYPNLTGLEPGTQTPLYAFNHDTVNWYIYGYGRVSLDGKTIVPEVDPTTGRAYGLRDFSWHGPQAAPTGNPSPNDDCPKSEGSQPVDYATGVKIERLTDVAFGGARGGISLTRIFTSDLAAVGVIGRFGRGWRDNFDIRLTGNFQAGGAGRLVLPEQRTGRLFSYASSAIDGTLIFKSTATVSQLGDELRKLTNGTFEYRLKSGDSLRFDNSGKLSAMIDRNLNTTTLSYDASGRLIQVMDAVGRSLTFTYNADNLVSRVTDPVGRVWQYSYVNTNVISGKQLADVVDPLLKGINYSYTLFNLTTIRDKRGNVVKQITYDGNGRVIRQDFAEGGFATYAYELSGGIVTETTITDSLGRRMKKRLNAAGYVIEQEDSLGQRATIERDLTTNLATARTGPCGCAEVRQTFDERGNVIAMTDRLGQTRRYEYEPVFNNLTKIIDELGRETRFDYDARGNLTTVTDALNQVTTIGYDTFGEVVSITDPLGHTSQLEYDAQGNVTARVDALNHRSTQTYDALGRITSIIDALGRTASVTYDALDRVLTITDAANAVMRFEYDANGNTTRVTDALNHRYGSTYDMRNRLIATSDPLQRVTKFAYDTEDQLLSATSASGRKVHYAYNARGEQVTMIDPMGGAVRLTYDHRGNVIGLQDQRNNTTTFEYDALYRPVKTRDPLGRESRATYDGASRVTESIDRLGRQVRFNYDLLDRLTSAVYQDATVTYTYDAASRPTRIDDTQSGLVSWTYDEADRLLSETTPAGVLSYAYNNADQVTGMTAADQLPVGYAYDAAGRLQSITQGSESFTYAYDALSRITALQRPNGVTTTYGYDSVNRLNRLLHTNAANQTIEDLRYTFNLDDEIETLSSLNAAPLLPQTKTANAADAASRLSQFGSTSYTFDHLGQTTSKSDATGTTNYTWDARGRLTKVTLPNGQAVDYAYDGLGRRASRTINHTTTNFLYDGADVVLDRRSDSTSVSYLNGIGIDDKLRQASNAASSLYFLQDHLGSTTALTDASGAVVERQQYEPFGASMGTSLTRYGYTGREKDEATGLLYYRARWYDPEQGRFITQDPIGFAGGDTNLYAYVGNEPINAFDPSGTQTRSDRMWYPGEKNPRTGRPYGEYEPATPITSRGSQAPSGCECNSGNPVEVVIWYPSNGHGSVGWGGHVSYNIDGYSFSFQGGGWATVVPFEDYRNDNQEYRSGVGYVLDFGSPEKNRAFANSLMHGYEGQDPLFGIPPSKWPYNLITNNCGHAFSRALWDNGLGMDFHVAPIEHQYYIENFMQANIRKRNFYPYKGLSDALRDGGTLDQMMREVNRQRGVLH